MLAGQGLQILGALCVLAGFAAAQTGILSPRSRAYLWLNLAGSALLTVLAIVERQLGFVVLQAVWAMVSAASLVTLRSRKTEKLPGSG